MKITCRVLLALLLITPFAFGQTELQTKLREVEDDEAISTTNMRYALQPCRVLRYVRNGNEIAAFTSFTRNDGDTTETPRKKGRQFRMKKSPAIAVLLSAVVPGAGQLYNQSYWKTPIIWGLVGYFGYEYFRQNNLYKDYRDLYSQSQLEIPPEGNLSYKSLREFYRDQRNDFVWYFTIVYVINLIDAYIDAHLFDFDVREEKLTRFGDADKTYRLKFNVKF